jgi:hypothetical protein
MDEVCFDVKIQLSLSLFMKHLLTMRWFVLYPTGGFEGASLNNKYIGYRGFPGRLLTGSDRAVDFKDFGLPLVTSKKPQTLEDHSLMKPPRVCGEDNSFAICNAGGRRHNMRG